MKQIEKLEFEFMHSVEKPLVGLFQSPTRIEPNLDVVAE